MQGPLNQDIFWEGAGRDEALAKLCLAGRRHRLMLVTGAPGSGVSHVLGAAAMELVDCALPVRFDGAAGPGPAGIMGGIRAALGATHENLAEKLRESRPENPLVVIIDNAEELGEDALMVLSRLYHRLGEGFGLILGAADEELAGRLHRLEMSPELLSLAPLDREEAAGFLAHVAGVEPEPGELDRICEQGGGRPGALLKAAGVSGGVPLLPPGVPWKHVASVAGLALLIVLLWPREDEGELRELELPREVRESEEVTPRESPGDSSPREPAAASPPRDRLAGEPDVPEPVGEPESAPPDRSPSGPAAETEPPEPAAQEVEQKVEQEEVDPQEEKEAVGIVSEGEPELSGREAEFGYRREDWLLGMPGSQWMLQLTLARNEDAARIIADRVGRDRVAYYRGSREGRPTFVVLAGPWDSADAARAGREELPAELRETGPFPRKLTDIQGEITQ